MEMKTASSAPNFNYGYPTPGPQNPTPSAIMDHVFFLPETHWKSTREEQEFDYIIIGSGFCAFAFAERALENNPCARILILERGTFFLPEHFQNLPLPYQGTLGGLSETFPWALSPQTVRQKFIRWSHGMVPFFGGRSTLWSGWCLSPTPDEMRLWPSATVEAAQSYLPSARCLLNVVSADRIDPDGVTATAPCNRPIYATLQKKLTALLVDPAKRIPSVTRVIPAPLAVGSADLHGVDFEKFAVPGPLLGLVVRQRQLAEKGKGAPLQVATNCIVTRVLEHEGAATALETSRGVVNIGNAKIILAMGAVPPATLILNSFPQVPNVGNRFTAHFITAVVARVHRDDYNFCTELSDLELAAIYVAGVDPTTKQQYHIQLTGLSDRNPVANAAAAARNMPDVVATASAEQLLTSEDHVVFVCAVLGELDHNNPNTWLRKNEGGDPTTNVMLQVMENENDLRLWDTMDEATFQALEQVLSPKGTTGVEYWHVFSDGSGAWLTQRPTMEQRRVPGLVHEGSTMHIGEGADAVVGLDYRPKGVENVYVTGASLWPTSGSWNPTLTMVALAQHLADNLTEQP